MWNISINHCPYDHWEAVAKSACSTSEQFHCLKDEFERIGWLCAEPIWVEDGRCPVYNSGAGMLHTTACIGEGCPSSNYRSNDVHIKHSCRLNESAINGDKSTSYPTEVNEDMGNYMYIIGTVGVVLVLVIIGTIVLLRRRREQLCRQEHDVEEYMSLMVPSSTKLSEAENYLEMNHFVALIGIEGSGRTHLAKQLAESIKKYKIHVCWINDILNYKLDTLLSEKKLVILDDIFYVLQNEDEVNLVASKVEDLYQKKRSPYIIVTLPSYIWERHADAFSNKESFKCHVDLNNLSKEERECILREHLNLNDIRNEENARAGDLFISNAVKAAIIDSPTCKSMGFPSCVAWIGKMRDQKDIHEADRFMQLPVFRIRNDVKFLKNTTSIGKNKMFLLLAYAALSGGILDVTQIDKEFLYLLASTLYPNDEPGEFLHDFDASLLALEEKFINKQPNGKYEFQLDIVKTITFVVAIEKNMHVLKEKVNKDLLKRLAVERDIFPTGFDTDFAKCFVKM